MTASGREHKLQNRIAFQPAFFRHALAENIQLIALKFRRWPQATFKQIVESVRRNDLNKARAPYSDRDGRRRLRPVAKRILR